MKVEANEQDIENNLSLAVCRLFCGAQVGTLWPYPTGQVKVGNTLVRFNPERVTFDTTTFKNSKQHEAEHKNLLALINAKKPKSLSKALSGSQVLIKFKVTAPEEPFSLDLDQSYELQVNKPSDDQVVVQVTAQNAFGMRYALVTLSQLMVYDDIRRELLVSGKRDWTNVINHIPYKIHFFSRSQAMSPLTMLLNTNTVELSWTRQEITSPLTLSNERSTPCLCPS